MSTFVLRASTLLALGLAVGCGSSADGAAEAPRAWRVLRAADPSGVFMSAATLSDGATLVVGGAPTRGTASRLVSGALVEDAAPAGALLTWASTIERGATWVVGNERRALRRDVGGAWTAETTPAGDQLWGCKAFSDEDVWAVGGDLDASDVATPVIVHRGAGSWTRVGLPDVGRRDARLYKIDGDRPDDVVAVGAEGLVLAWDGSSWTLESSGTGISLSTVRAIGDGRFVAVGGWIDSGTGVVLMRDASKTWTTLAQTKAGLAGFDRVGDSLWACGVRGWLQRIDLRGSTLEEVSAGPTRDSLHFVLALPGGGALSGGGDFSAWTGTLLAWSAAP